MSRVSKSDREEFAQYLRQLTDAQVLGVIEKEKAANRRVYAELAEQEAARRGVRS
jgi:hypothetical protein